MRHMLELKVQVLVDMDAHKALAQLAYHAAAREGSMVYKNSACQPLTFTKAHHKILLATLANHSASRCLQATPTMTYWTAYRHKPHVDTGRTTMQERLDTPSRQQRHD